MNTNTQSPTKHTPTPWHYDIDDEFAGLCIHSEYGCIAQLCQTPDVDAESIATAAFIVRACNTHAQLVAALEYIVKFSGPLAGRGTEYEMALEQARAALSAAKE